MICPLTSLSRSCEDMRSGSACPLCWRMFSGGLFSKSSLTLDLGRVVKGVTVVWFWKEGKSEYELSWYSPNMKISNMFGWTTMLLNIIISGKCKKGRSINRLGSEQNDWHFTDDTLKLIFLKRVLNIWFKLLSSLFLRVHITNDQQWFRWWLDA